MAENRDTQAYRPVVVLLAFYYYWFIGTTGASDNLVLEQGNKKFHGHSGPCTELRGKIFDCSYRNLRDIPNSTFPEGLVELDLSWNALTSVNSGTFQKQTLLRSLDLSHNHIYQLEQDAFMGLRRLWRLSLRYNDLVLSEKTYTKNLMKDLASLKHLLIDQNKDMRKYSKLVSCPVEAFQMLSNLSLLSTDIPEQIDIGSCFGGFAELKSLSSGGDSHGCKVPRLTNSTFERFQGNLTELRLTACAIKDIELDTFYPLKHLDVLDISFNMDITIAKALRGLHGLQGRTMSKIDLSLVNPVLDWERDPYDFVLTGNMTRYLKNICVRRLDISTNFILGFHAHDFPTFNKSCLQKFLMRGHSMRKFPKKFILANINNNNVLKFVDVTGWSLLPFTPPLGHTASVEKGSRLNEKLNIKVERLNISDVISGIPLQRIQTMYLSNINASTLRNLDASYNRLRGCTYAFRGLDGLSVLNISRSDCSDISPKLFTNFGKLRVLIFRDSLLNVSFANYGKGDVFKFLANLREIDLSKNDFLAIHQDIFTPLREVTEVRLQGNKFDNVPTACLGVLKLQYLDMSDNVISQLNKHDMDRFDQFNMAAKTKNSSFSLALSGNPLACNCDTQDFVDWMLTTNVNVIYNDHLRCTLNNGRLVTLESLKKECAEFRITGDSIWLSWTIPGFVLMVLAIILGALGYRNKWRLRYWFTTLCRNEYEPIP